LQAIWREAAAKPEDPVSLETPRSHDVGPASRAIADKSRSYGLRPASKTLANKFAPTEPVLLARFAAVNARPGAASAEGVGALLAGDLARSGSQT